MGKKFALAAIVSITALIATSAPAAAVHRFPVPDDLVVGGGPVEVWVEFIVGGTDLPGPLEVRTTINDEGLPAEKPRKK